MKTQNKNPFKYKCICDWSKNDEYGFIPNLKCPVHSQPIIDKECQQTKPHKKKPISVNEDTGLNPVSRRIVDKIADTFYIPKTIEQLYTREQMEDISKIMFAEGIRVTKRDLSKDMIKALKLDVPKNELIKLLREMGK